MCGASLCQRLSLCYCAICVLNQMQSLPDKEVFFIVLLVLFFMLMSRVGSRVGTVGVLPKVDGSRTLRHKLTSFTANIEWNTATFLLCL